jgi:hypothetical protein
MEYQALEQCVCGKSFVSGAGFSNHSRICQQSKKRLSTVLETAREAFRARKKHRMSFSSILRKGVCSMLRWQLSCLRYLQSDQNGPLNSTPPPIPNSFHESGAETATEVSHSNLYTPPLSLLIFA